MNAIAVADSKNFSKLIWLLGEPNQKPKTNWSCLLPPARPMSTLRQYGRMAEKHWRQFRPRMVQELEAKGLLEQMLLEAEEKTDEELDTLTRDLMKQGLTAQQAHDQAWEMVRERYIFLPPEDQEP